MSKIYTTVQGDMWDSIAYQQLGDVRYVDILINANIQHKDIYIFSAGVELTIPEIETVVSGSNLPPWKRVMT